MKNVLAILIFSFLTLPSWGDDLTEQFFQYSENPDLTPKEKRSLNVATKELGLSVDPIKGNDGSIRFLFGAEQPTVICAVLQVCDIALQAGEQINSLHLGDGARWTIEPAVTGGGSSEIQHLIVKPMDVGLVTSLVVTTDKRTYHIKLKSHRSQYMSQVAFSYPEDSLKKFQNIQLKQIEEREKNTIPGTREYLGNLSFNYDISGDAKWKPIRVYNDGVKTIIEMPEKMKQEAPTLLVLIDKKKWIFFKTTEKIQVNYRLQNNKYIVDSVFDKAMLVAGVGSNQTKVTITNKEKN